MTWDLRTIAAEVDWDRGGLGEAEGDVEGSLQRSAVCRESSVKSVDDVQRKCPQIPTREVRRSIYLDPRGNVICDPFCRARKAG